MGGRHRSVEEWQAINEEAARRFLETRATDRPELWDEVYSWIAQDPAHGVAFAKAETSWELTERLRDIRLELEPEEIAGPAGHIEVFLGRRAVIAMWLAVALIGTLMTVAIQKFAAVDHYRTAIGEERVVRIADGSLVHLNTNSSVEIGMRDSRRFVRLLRGEASFRISPDPDRPFLVYSRGFVLQAVGTSFNVRLRPEFSELTVIRGKVIVRAGESSPREVAERTGAAIRAGSVAINQLTPSQIARRTAWQDGVVRFSDATLAEAVAEFNRYRTAPILVGDPELASLRIDGTFPITASERFLQMLHKDFHIRTLKGTDHAVILLPAEESAAHAPASGRTLSVNR